MIFYPFFWANKTQNDLVNPVSPPHDPPLLSIRTYII